MTESASTIRPDDARLLRRDIVYAAVLLATAATTVVLVARDAGFFAEGHDWVTAGFFVAFGVFTIATGFPHPAFGHVSFDRVAQVMSVLVLGPIDAAWVNGLASFIYPWHRLQRGVPLPTVLMAAMHNSGLMMFVILGSGLLYQALGGPVPLLGLDAGTAVLLLLLVVTMQVVNDLGMMLILYLRGGDPRQVFNRFTTLTEFVAAATGIALAIAYNGTSAAYFVLLLGVFISGMLVIMQYALMRYRLEKLVEERTEDLRVQAREFERQATHDKLTGLPNRRYAENYLQQQIDLAARNDEAGAVALADIDHFKHINDGYSHAIGDRVLERVARLLGDGCRKTDFVARYGGEEFLLYFPGTQAGRAHEVCSQLRQSIQDEDWSGIAAGLSVTISFGVAQIDSSSRKTTILNEADMRLYRAKREGRNRVIAA